MYVYTGGNIENEDVGTGVTPMPTKNCNRPSIRRIRDGGVSRIFQWWPFPPDDVGYAACLEVPANDR